MASAVCVKGYWYLSFRGPFEPKRKLRRAPDSHQEKALADDLAKMADRAARVVERPELEARLSVPVDAAKRILLTVGIDVQGTRVDKYDPTNPTLLQAAMLHPRCRAEKERDRESYTRHERELLEYGEWAGSHRLRDLTLDSVVRYVDHLKAEGLAYDSRRHRLLFLRRASAMAPRFSWFDPLAGLQVDERPKKAPRVQTFTEKDLGLLLAKGALPPRYRAAVALQALCGLRPTEALRVRTVDLDLDRCLLHVGTVEDEDLDDDGEEPVEPIDVKNAPSARTIPLPPTALVWVAQLARPKDAEAPLITSEHRARKGAALDHRGFNRRLKAKLETITSRDGLKTKHLRKTWRTLAERWGAPRHLLEEYMGHMPAGGEVTFASYRERTAEDLRPVAEVVEARIPRLLTLDGVQPRA